ncbi:hypothetical protein BGX20_004317, partial [Mortierella sp. AD010]
MEADTDWNNDTKAEYDDSDVKSDNDAAYGNSDGPGSNADDIARDALIYTTHKVLRNS